MNDLDQLNQLYLALQDATVAATHAQHDLIVFMQQHLHGKQERPPLSMQTIADELWQHAVSKQEALSDYLNDRLR